jgi:C1A family cysteine protease
MLPIHAAQTLSRNRKFGWTKQLPDPRDLVMSWTKEQLNVQKISVSLDLRNSYMPGIYDQGTLGSCTGNAVCAAYTYVANSLKVKNPILSRMFIYYNARVLGKTVNYDSGAYIRDCMKSVNKQGISPEIDYPYKITSFKQKPSNKAYTNAKLNLSVKYLSVVISSDSFKTALSNGFPVIFGFAVPNYFISNSVSKTGIMPEYKGESILGGHAVLACGYDDNTRMFLIRNSWGTKWGQAGYFYMPFSFVNSGLLADAWILKVVT